MEIDEAIRLQETVYERNIFNPIPKYREASKLGLEALKRIQKGRAVLKWPFCDRPLPGETIKPVQHTCKLNPKYPCMLED